MKKLTSLIFLTMLILWIPEAWACRPPDYAEVDIRRSGITFHFSWDEGKAPIGCEEGTAVEFEFLIDTYPLDKCFAQPPGGKDEYVNVATFSPPSFAKIAYTDVWNYYFDYTLTGGTLEIYNILTDQCGEDINGLWALASNLYDRKIKDLDDKTANFAVGTTDPQQFVPGVEYEVFYPLEKPDQRPECDDLRADDGYAKIAMAVIPNTCTLDNDPNIFNSDFTTYDCPHLLAYRGCEEYEGDPPRYTLQHRLCVPTGDAWKIENPGNPEISRGGGICVDEDNDNVFDNFPKVEIYGNNLLDCYVSDEIEGTEGDAGSASWEFLYPNPQQTAFYEQTLVTALRVADPDGVKQFTVTIDDLQSESCKVRKKVSLSQNPTDYALMLDLEDCLGYDYGDHSFRVWIVDRCDNIYTTDALPFRYLGGPDTCSSSSSGSINYADMFGNVYYDIADSDGIVLSSINVNGIDEDRCKFRAGVRQNGTEKVINRNITEELNLNLCFVEGDVLDLLSLWVVDRCGKVIMVDAQPL